MSSRASALARSEEALTMMESQDTPSVVNLAHHLAILARQSDLPEIANAAEGLERVAAQPGPKSLTQCFNQLSEAVARAQSQG